MSIAVSEVGEERQVQVSTCQSLGIEQLSAAIGSPSVFLPGQNI